MASNRSHAEQELTNEKALLNEVQQEWLVLYGKLNQVKVAKEEAARLKLETQSLYQKIVVDQANADTLINEMSLVITEKFSSVVNLNQKLAMVKDEMAIIKTHAENALRQAGTIINIENKLTKQSRALSHYSKHEYKALPQEQKHALLNMTVLQAARERMQQLSLDCDNNLVQIARSLAEIKDSNYTNSKAYIRVANRSGLQETESKELNLSLMVDFVKWNAKERASYNDLADSVTSQLTDYKNSSNARIFYGKTEQRESAVSAVMAKVVNLAPQSMLHPQEAFDDLLATLDAEVVATQNSHNQNWSSLMFAKPTLVQAFDKVFEALPAEVLAASRARTAAKLEAANPAPAVQQPPLA